MSSKKLSQKQSFRRVHFYLSFFVFLHDVGEKKNQSQAKTSLIGSTATEKTELFKEEQSNDRKGSKKPFIRIVLCL